MNIPLDYRRLHGIGLLLLSLCYPIPGKSGELDTYEYKLEESNNDKVCSHMAKVYNHFFKRPFSMAMDQEIYLKGEGNQPELLPGAERDWLSFVGMRFSISSTSPEFDAIKWQVGKQIRPNHGEQLILNFPFIAADMDIKNDGKLETVIKGEFKTSYLDYTADSMSIFRKGDIDLTRGPIDWDVPLKGQDGHAPLDVIYGPQSTCSIVRPFIYDGVTYLSCYHRKWLRDLSDYRKGTPHWEYTDVLKYQGVERLPEGKVPLKAEMICRFRMHVTK